MKQSRKEFILQAHKEACSTWKTKIEKEFPELFNETFKSGDIFLDTYYDEKYILAQTGERYMCLISLEDGNRYTNPIKVRDLRSVSVEEVEKMCGYDYGSEVIKV